MRCGRTLFNAVLLGQALRHSRSGAAALQLRGGLQIQQWLQNNVNTSPQSILPSLRRFYSSKFNFESNPETSFLERLGLRRKQYQQSHQQQVVGKMSNNLYQDDTPAEVKNAKGLHLISMNTPNGQAVQIFLEELKDAYGTEWTTTMINIMTNVQKEDWFLRLNPNGIHKCRPTRALFGRVF